MAVRLRDLGIPNTEPQPWGSHLCQFYETKQDLLEVLVPYFAAGLAANEACLWVTSEPLAEPEARQAMMQAVPGFDRYLDTRQMQIVPCSDWYLRDGSFDEDTALGAAARALAAPAEGCRGLRASGNMAWLPKPRWDDFARYEAALDSLIAGHDAMTICSYPAGRCGVKESLDVMSNHRLALIRQHGAWQLVENTAPARMAAALQRREEEYRRLFESTQDGIEVIDGGTGRVVLVNQAAARIFGYDSPREMVGINPLDHIPAEDRDSVAAMIAEYLFEKDMHRVMEIRAIRKDGATVWLSAVGVRADFRGRVSGVVSLRDVTGHRQAEQALWDTEQRYRLLAENVSDVIWVTDMDLRPVYFSPSVARLLGYSVEEAMSGNLETRLTADSLKRATAAFDKAMAREQARPGRAAGSGTLELQFKHKDGSLVWVDTTVSLVRDSGGRPLEILGVLRDISQRKHAEEQLHRSLGKLERTLESAIQAIASTVETKDVYTAGHQRRVTQLACATAREMGLPGERVQVIRTAGLLHDLGKISLPTDILTKPGQLTQPELAVIRTHPRVAYDVLRNIESFDRIALVVLQHHERMNGSGYPSGLQGGEILLEARILAVSDVIEAMFSYRPYRPALGLERALDEVTRNRGPLYDPAVVDACLAVFRQGRFQFRD